MDKISITTSEGTFSLKFWQDVVNAGKNKVPGTTQISYEVVQALIDKIEEQAKSSEQDLIFIKNLQTQLREQAEKIKKLKFEVER